MRECEMLKRLHKLSAVPKHQISEYCLDCAGGSAYEDCPFVQALDKMKEVSSGLQVGNDVPAPDYLAYPSK